MVNRQCSISVVTEGCHPELVEGFLVDLNLVSVNRASTGSAPDEQDFNLTTFRNLQVKEIDYKIIAALKKLS